MSKFVTVTPMKNEGPFIVEWVAHNLAIGVDQIAVFFNDCTDGSDALLERLDAMGKIRHFDNSSHRQAPQRRAYRRFMKMALAEEGDWVIPIDADEFINVKTGGHTLAALTDAVPSARTISMTWKLFGNGGVDAYEDSFITDQFRMSAPEHKRTSYIAWGFKTMFQRGVWNKMGVHRPYDPARGNLRGNGLGKRIGSADARKIQGSVLALASRLNRLRACSGQSLRPEIL